jgi:hypothetical protein
MIFFREALLDEEFGSVRFGRVGSGLMRTVMDDAMMRQCATMFNFHFHAVTRFRWNYSALLYKHAIKIITPGG